MCAPKAPKMPDPVTYAAPAPEPEKAPVLKDPLPTKEGANAVRAGRRGTRALRTDLGIPGAGTGGAAKGLNIPK